MKARLGIVTDRHCGAAVLRQDYCSALQGLSLTIAVRCRLGLLPQEHLALLDTGAAYSVVSEEVVESIADHLGEPLSEISMSTRFGRKEGDLYRLPATLLSDEGHGRDLTVESTFAVLRDWPGPVVLGFKGFLERLCITIDPGVGHSNPAMLFFGPAS